MRMKNQLNLDLKNSINKTDRRVIENQLRILENYLSVKCAEINKNLVLKYCEELDSQKGVFSQHGLWKLKAKLCKTSVDPPMAKIDTNGLIVTAPNLLRDLYLRTYCDRLRNRVIKKKNMKIYSK